MEPNHRFLLYILLYRNKKLHSSLICNEARKTLLHGHNSILNLEQRDGLSCLRLHFEKHVPIFNECWRENLISWREQGLNCWKPDVLAAGGTWISDLKIRRTCCRLHLNMPTLCTVNYSLQLEFSLNNIVVILINWQPL